MDLPGIPSALPLGREFAEALLRGVQDAPQAPERGGPALGGTAEWGRSFVDGEPAAGLPSEVMRAVTQALSSSLAAATAAANNTPTPAQDPMASLHTHHSSTVFDAAAAAAAQPRTVAPRSADVGPPDASQPQSTLAIDRDAHLVLQVPLPAARAPEVVAVPVLVAPLHAGPAADPAAHTQREQERRRRGTADFFEPQDDDADAHGDGAHEHEAQGSNDASDAPTTPANVLRFARLWPLLQSAPQPGVLAELAQRRRVMLILPSAYEASSALRAAVRAPSERPGGAHAGASALQLDAHLLGIDAQGNGRAALYRARGALAATLRRAGDDDSDGASRWHQWRLHRDATIGAQPRLVASRSAPLQPSAHVAPSALAVRLSPTPQPPPLRDANTTWLDVLDPRRFVDDLGPQWSLLVLWCAA